MFMRLSTVTLIVFLFIYCGCSSAKLAANKTVLSSTDTLALLTSRPYYMEEINILQDNKFFTYKKGQSGNTAKFDDEYIKFNKDKTGYYYYYGEIDKLNWEFVDDCKTKIRYTLHRTTPIILNWENISYSSNSISYSEYYTSGELRSMAIGMRTAK